jgi:hypothetical protein
MEKAMGFIRFMIIASALFFMAGVFVTGLVLALVFITIGTLRHIKNQLLKRI